MGIQPDLILGMSGMLICSTSRVIAIAKIPSLNASIRLVLRPSAIDLLILLTQRSFLKKLDSNDLIKGQS